MHTILGLKDLPGIARTTVRDVFLFLVVG